MCLQRWVKSKYPKLSSDKYWDQVDASLTEYRQKFPDSGEIQMYDLLSLVVCTSADPQFSAFKVAYDEDIKKYGQPDVINNPTTAAHEVDSWLRTVNTHAGAIVASAGLPTE